jgi:hypothetical protein
MPRRLPVEYPRKLRLDIASIFGAGVWLMSVPVILRANIENIAMCENSYCNRLNGSSLEAHRCLQ